jgi:hypothetical protein
MFYNKRHKDYICLSLPIGNVDTIRKSNITLIDKNESFSLSAGENV